MEDQKLEHIARVRYLKPIEPVNFSVQDMLSGIFAAINPSLVASINQLHGDRKGVVRLSCKTKEALEELEAKVASRRVQVNGVRLAPVGVSGHFVKIILYDVPEYLTSVDIDAALRDYGHVVHVKREYLDYHGYKIENETRQVLFSTLARDIPSRITLAGQDVYVNYRPQATGKEGTTTAGTGAVPIIQPSNIPKHVMNSMLVCSDVFRRAYRVAGNTPNAATTNANNSPEVFSDGEKERSTMDLTKMAASKRSVSASTSPNLARYQINSYVQVPDIDDDDDNENNDNRQPLSLELHNAHARPENTYSATPAQSRIMQRRRSVDHNPEREFDNNRFTRSKSPDADLHV